MDIQTLFSIIWGYVWVDFAAFLYGRSPKGLTDWVINFILDDILKKEWEHEFFSALDIRHPEWGILAEYDVQTGKW